MRQNFFDDRNSYLLYLWDVPDEHDLIQLSMQQLLEGIGSGNGGTGVPSVIGSKHNNDADDLLGPLPKKSKGQNDDNAFLQLTTVLKSTASPSSLPQRSLQASRQRIVHNKLSV